MIGKTYFLISMIVVIAMMSSCGGSVKTGGVNKVREKPVPRIEGISDNVLVMKSGKVSMFLDASGKLVPFLEESATNYALIFRENAKYYPPSLYIYGKYHFTPGDYKVDGYLGKVYVPTFSEHFGKFPVIEVISIEKIAVDK